MRNSNIKHKNNSKNDTEALKTEHQKDFNNLKEQLFDQKKDELEKLGKDKDERINKLEALLQELGNSFENLKNNHSRMLKEKEHIEILNKETNNKLDFSTNELKIYKEELDNLRNQNKNLDSTKFNQEKNITEISIRNEHLIKEIQSKDQTIKNLEDLVNNLKKQRVN